MYTLQGKNLRYSLNEEGKNTSFYSVPAEHETIEIPGYIWKIIYSVPGTEQVESVICQKDNQAEFSCSENEIRLFYRQLQGEDGRIIQAQFTLRLQMEERGLQTIAALESHDENAILQEVQLTPVSGVRSLGEDHARDYIAWPRDLGIRVPDPAYNDLSTYAGFRKYERHDQFHTDMDALYQGELASMEWYDWYNENSGVYTASEDTSRHTLCLHAERDTQLNVLRFGIIYYPMLEKDECWEGAAVDSFPHAGDWHTGSKIYREFMFKKAGFTAPKRPDWCRDMTGWLRIILKQHHCELNWDYSDIPALYDELEAAGFKTLYLLGWEKGGFARMWPDYIVDERMGGEKLLRKGIDYVHSKGGKVLMFLSYALIDKHSDFYRLEGGDTVSIKSLWGDEVPFSETYCGEGTYRKIGNPPMPMYLACPGAPLWQEKMKWSAKQCFDLGADGVLYDIGAWYPYFCYDKTHSHAKPSHSHEHKEANYRELREYVKSFGEDKIILMEHNADLFGQSMDISHGANTIPDDRLLNPETAEDLSKAHLDSRLSEMYLYTFPELLTTNRECGEDEEHFKANAGYSFLFGLRFDMTVFRCCGSLKDIPNYTVYLKELNTLYVKHAKHLLQGRFVDQDGFTSNNPFVFAKGWQAEDGSLAVTLWNPTGKDQVVRLKPETGNIVEITVSAEGVAVAEL